MKKSITKLEFIQSFVDHNRAENFSYEGELALYDYFTELENDLGEEIEHDVIAICCDFSEYENEKDALEDYRAESIEELEKHTDVIELDNGGVIIRAF